MICTSKSNYSHFFAGYHLFKLVLFPVGFLVVFFFTYVLCQNISPSCLENLLNIGIRYIDKYILPSFHNYPGQADHCAVILQFVIPVILFEPQIFSQALQ